ETGAVYRLPVTGEIVQIREGDEVRVQARATARLDVGKAALGRPLPPGLWEVHLRMSTGAHHARARARMPSTPRHCVGGLAEGGGGWGRRGGGGGGAPAGGAAPGWSPAWSPRGGAGGGAAARAGRVFVRLPVRCARAGGGPPMECVLVGTDARARTVSAPALV